MIFSKHCVLLLIGTSISYGIVLKSAEQGHEAARQQDAQAAKGSPRELALARLRADLDEGLKKQKLIDQKWEESQEAQDAAELNDGFLGALKKIVKSLQEKQ